MQISEANLPPGSKELDKRQAKTDNWKRKLLPNLSHMIILVITHLDNLPARKSGGGHVTVRTIEAHAILRPCCCRAADASRTATASSCLSGRTCQPSHAPSRTCMSWRRRSGWQVC